METRFWLKDIRRKKGFTQEDLANLLGIAKTTYASYEQGYRTPSVKKAKKIANALDFTWTIFFDQ